MLLHVVHDDLLQNEKESPIQETRSLIRKVKHSNELQYLATSRDNKDICKTVLNTVHISVGWHLVSKSVRGLHDLYNLIKVRANASNNVFEAYIQQIRINYTLSP